MTQTSNQKNESVERFRQRMAEEGKAEVRGVYLHKDLHPNAKTILKNLPEHHEKIMLFLNSLHRVE